MEFNIKPFLNYEQYSKKWGREYWLTNRPEYCAKLLEIQPGYQCSLHMHKIKKETFIVLEGSVGIEWGPLEHLTIARFDAGESINMPALMLHRFWALDGQPALVLEVSTHHDDNDVERITESCAWEPL